MRRSRVRFSQAAPHEAPGRTPVLLGLSSFLDLGEHDASRLVVCPRPEQIPNRSRTGSGPGCFAACSLLPRMTCRSTRPRLPVHLTYTLTRQVGRVCLSCEGVPAVNQGSGVAPGIVVHVRQAHHLFPVRQRWTAGLLVRWQGFSLDGRGNPRPGPLNPDFSLPLRNLPCHRAKTPATPVPGSRG